MELDQTSGDRDDSAGPGVDDEGPRWWGEPNGLLPTWYMPPPSARRLGGWRAKVIVAIVLALLLIEVAGLCVTYGPPIS